jgi:uncharacterized membrane protein YhaH (DUF805 family)
MWDSPMHILIILLLLTFLIPIFRIIRRTGHSGWWCLLAFVPLLNWIGLWILAYTKWPTVDRVTK